MGLAEVLGGPRFAAYLQECRESRRLVLVIVAIALLLDNMLLTTVGKSSAPAQIFAFRLFCSPWVAPLVEFSDFQRRSHSLADGARTGMKKKNWRATFSGVSYNCVFCALVNISNGVRSPVPWFNGLEC
jgi:uncharacterized protein involved in cysteine biosynthesis